MTQLTTDKPAQLPTFVGLPQTTDAAAGWTLLRSGTARTLAETVTGSDAILLTETALAICASLTPAKPEQIAVEIEALALHYPAMSRTREESKIVNRNWIEDLDGWPIDILRETCRQWRNSNERFFPTPGQLKAMGEKILSARKVLADRSREYLLLTEPGA